MQDRARTSGIAQSAFAWIQRTRLTPLLALIVGLALLAGCGRVDLEDLTPEAFKTQQASITPTATNPPRNTAAAGETQVADFSDADLQAGMVQYNTWCSACHDSGRATALKGTTIDFTAIEQTMRTGTGFSAPHPKYSLTEITNGQFNNILAYIASQPAQ